MQNPSAFVLWGEDTISILIFIQQSCEINWHKAVHDNLDDNRIGIDLKALSLSEKGWILLEMNTNEQAFEVLKYALALKDSSNTPIITVHGDLEIEYFL